MTEQVEIRFPVGDIRVVLHCQCGAELVLDPTKKQLPSGKVRLACPVGSSDHDFDSATVAAAWHIQEAVEGASQKKQLSLIVKKN